jgi:hypothetical protein
LIIHVSSVHIAHYERAEESREENEADGEVDDEDNDEEGVVAKISF